MANPQIEHGYTKIANKIMDALCKNDISGSEFMIILAVMRRTYGWSKKEDQISLTEFQKLTCMNKKRIIRAIKNLVSRRILGSVTGGTGGSVTGGPNPVSPVGLPLYLKETKETLKKAKFIPPNIQDVLTYCLERKNNIDPQYFFDRNTAMGWVDKNSCPYKDWKAVIRTWEKFDNVSRTKSRKLPQELRPGA